MPRQDGLITLNLAHYRDPLHAGQQFDGKRLRLLLKAQGLELPGEPAAKQVEHGTRLALELRLRLTKLDIQGSHGTTITHQVLLLADAGTAVLDPPRTLSSGPRSLRAVPVIGYAGYPYQERTMTDTLLQYGLFLAKLVTVLIAIGASILMTAYFSRKRPAFERLVVKSLNKKYAAMGRLLKKQILSKRDFRRTEKARKRMEKKRLRGAEDSTRNRVFVISFRGDVRATAVASLREEVTAVLTLATQRDEVLVRLDNAGGFVHEHGLAASQLLRVKQNHIPLTVAVDKVAASGGYMMACVADRIIAAPFAIVGSIGIVAQLPNFRRLLERHGVDFEQIKAGDFKRTITMFGENTEKERAKLKQQVEETHTLFKNFVTDHRPQVDVAHVATGEHWYGTRALALKLVDALVTSDDYLMTAAKKSDLYEVSYVARKTVSERLFSAIQSMIGL